MNTRITSFFGMHTTLSETLRPLDNTATSIGFINRWLAKHQGWLTVHLKLNTQISVIIRGYHTAMVFFRPQSLRDLAIRQGRVLIRNQGKQLGSDSWNELADSSSEKPMH